MKHQSLLLKMLLMICLASGLVSCKPHTDKPGEPHGHSHD